MDKKNFTLSIENREFCFEIDNHGYVWIIEDNKKFQFPEKTNIGQVRPTNSLEEAKEIALIMLYSSGRIKRLYQ